MIKHFFISIKCSNSFIWNSFRANANNVHTCMYVRTIFGWFGVSLSTPKPREAKGHFQFPSSSDEIRVYLLQPPRLYFTYQTENTLHVLQWSRIHRISKFLRFHRLLGLNSKSVTAFKHTHTHEHKGQTIISSEIIQVIRIRPINDNKFITHNIRTAGRKITSTFSFQNLTFGYRQNYKCITM